MNPKSIALTTLLALALSLAGARAITFTASTHIGAGNTAYDGQDVLVLGCTLTVDGSHQFRSLTLNGAILNHSPAPNAEPNNRLRLTISGDVLVDAGSRIDVSGRGCFYPNTPGAAPHTGGHGGGGGHGGAGGYGYMGEPGGVSGIGSAVAPTSFGGSGSVPGSDPNVRVQGGGAVQITCDGTMTIQGPVLANGNSWVDNDQGAGAGGSIWLTAALLAGAGTISANGGNGEADYHGGGGGGGRIALYYGVSTFTGTLSARGGAGRQWGGAGTIFQKAVADPSGTLFLDNGGVWGAYTALELPVSARLCVSNMAQVFATTPLSLTSLLVASNAVLFHFPTQALNLTISGLAQIDLGGRISADGCGYPLGTNTGPGAAPFTGGEGGGGAHAGHGGYAYGGPSEPGGVGGYGSLLTPMDYGSTGAGSISAAQRTAGGGAIRLVVDGTLLVNGQISTTGQSSYQNDQGGGAGGSIWVTAGELAGTGVFAANGGNGEADSHGGGGAGGRIALYCNTNSFTGSVMAQGGAGRQWGGAGTIYRKLTSQSYGVLQCENQGQPGASTPIVVPTGSEMVITAGAVVYSQLGDEMVFRNLEIGPNGQLTHPRGQRLDVTVQQDARVHTNGLITANGLGYPVGTYNGPGAGAFNGARGGGGGYGGAGGRSWDGQPGGFPYGSAGAPSDWGSAGGGGTAGGGAIQIDVAGTLTLHGTISANGLDSPSEPAQGGGAGGSIWLNIGKLAGTGVITADGGLGKGNDGGGGGGGRIAVYHQGTSFDPTRITAHGANGSVWGGDGSVFFGYALSNTPPVVLAQSPAGTLNRWVEAVDLTFNVVVDGNTFTPSDVVFTTPSGVLPVPQITVTELTPQVFRIGFPRQTADGFYSVQVGPDIANAFGMPMAAPHTGTFAISFPHSLVCSNSPSGLAIAWPGTAGLFYRVQTSLNLTAWVDATDWLAGAGMPLQMTFPTTNAPQQFFRIVITD